MTEGVIVTEVVVTETKIMTLTVEVITDQKEIKVMIDLKKPEVGTNLGVIPNTRGMREGMENIEVVTDTSGDGVNF